MTNTATILLAGAILAVAHADIATAANGRSGELFQAHGASGAAGLTNRGGQSRTQNGWDPYEWHLANRCLMAGDGEACEDWMTEVEIIDEE